MRAYIKRTKCALHTKRTKGARAHHLHKLRSCIASAQSVYVYVKRTKHSCTSSARSMCVYIRRTAWHIRCTACTSGAQRARARQARKCAHSKRKKYARADQAHDAHVHIKRTKCAGTLIAQSVRLHIKCPQCAHTHQARRVRAIHITCTSSAWNVHVAR